MRECECARVRGGEVERGRKRGRERARWTYCCTQSRRCRLRFAHSPLPLSRSLYLTYNFPLTTSLPLLSHNLSSLSPRLSPSPLTSMILPPSPPSLFCYFSPFPHSSLSFSLPPLSLFLSQPGVFLLSNSDKFQSDRTQRNETESRVSLLHSKFFEHFFPAGAEFRPSNCLRWSFDWRSSIFDKINLLCSNSAY